MLCLLLFLPRAQAGFFFFPRRSSYTVLYHVAAPAVLAVSDFWVIFFAFPFEKLASDFGRSMSSV